MALTVVVPGTTFYDLSGIASSPFVIKTAKITGDANYPGGTGYVVTPGTFGLATQILGVQTVNPANQAQYATWDQVAKSIRFMNSGTATYSEAVSNSSVSTIALDVFVYGY